MSQEKENSHKQILKSTGILGSAQLIIILVGIVRVKVLAVLLGAAGVGIAGLYQTTIDLIKWTTSFGIGSSVVRDIAASAATKDEKKIAIAITVLRKWVWATGLLGMLVAIIFCRQLSNWAFGDKSHAVGIAILSVCLLLSAISSGQSALLQGLRRIADMAKANVLGAILGLIGAVIIYYFLGLKGIVPAIFFTFLIGLFVNWFFSRKIKVSKVELSTVEVFSKGKAMALLGISLTITGMASMAAMYLVRLLVAQNGGVSSVGHFVAAWTISSMYISAIFGAMSSDFYPRLSAVQNDSDAVKKMVNEQTEVALLITAPIIIGMISFIDLVVRIFYSKDFGPTAGILDWQLLGDFFKVLAWPMGFIILAKGRGKSYILIELFWNILYCSIVYFGWKYLGMQVTGVAFLLSYLLYMLLIFIINTRIIKFTWSTKVYNLIIIFLPLLLLSFLNVKCLNGIPQYVLGAILTLLASTFSLFNLKEMVNIRGMLEKITTRSRKG